MEISVRKLKNLTNCTISELYINNIFECIVLEDVEREVYGKHVSEWKIKDITAIPKGRYKVIIDKSIRFQKLMLHILDVPGFNGIRIHSGNTDKDTEGCLIVGQKINYTSERIEQSILALNSLFNKVNTALLNKEEVWINIRNGR